MPERKQISDTYLLNRLADGDMPAYETLFNRYYSTLCAYARLFVRGGEMCENIVQDLMLWLWENRTTLQVHESLSKYLFGAVRNRCLTYLSHEMIERRVLNGIRERMSRQFETPDFYVVSELQERIRTAVAELPDNYREAFERNRYRRQTYEEIAAELGISSKTVDYRIQQSLKILRVKLKDYLPLALLLLTASE